jgi:hypothetical protein
MMRAAACLHRHNTPRQAGEEGQQPTSTQRLAEYNLTPSIRAVRLKDALGDIQNR